MHVLLIEDNEDDAYLIREMLLEKMEAGIQLEWVDRLSSALTQLAQGKSDLVLLDLSLPDSRGLETFDTVQRCAPDVPIVVLTGLDDEAMAVQAVRGGAQDYLVKGRLVDSYLLSRAVRYAVERKQAERALRESEARLRQSQKMEGIGQLAGGIAHDFNNLLTVINSYSDMLLGEIGFDNPFVRNGLDQIKEAGHRAASLTRQLLAFTRQQVLEPKILDLNESVSTMAKLLRRLIGEDITLVLCPHPALGRVKVDPGQVEQIIMNLAVNARDAMPGGGELTIETRNVDLDGFDAHQQISAPGSYVMLGVSDTGCGMDADTKTRMFEPFFTTKGPGKGTGLGLATVYGIVKQSGGSIGVSSDLGKGTTFNIYLPCVEGAAEQLEPLSAPPAALRGSETILLVEDEEMVRALAQAILERSGYTVFAAKHVHDALRMAQEGTKAIHLLLTDTIMPGMNGPELAQQVLAIRPAIKVLYMSGYTDKAFTSTAALEPGFTFLQKPFTPQTLGQKVREILTVPQPNRTERAA